MNQRSWQRCAAAVLAAAGTAAVSAAAQSPQANCKKIHADLVENRSTTACRPGHAVCFLGQVDGNHDVQGTTYFHADSSAAGPATGLPGFISYSGAFEYTIPGGTLVTRETGVSNQSTGQPESGAVTAYQKIIDATGALAGASGHFFVSGFSANGRVVTQVTGEVCFP